MAGQTLTHVAWADVQGLVLRGYGDLPAARYLLLRIDHPELARGALGLLADLVTPATESPKSRAFHLALTAGGLRKLGVPVASLEGFSTAFHQGMVTEHRSRILGDYRQNAPSNWLWGNREENTPDLLFLVFSDSAQNLEVFCDELTHAASGCSVSLALEAKLPPDGRDHFNFRDGIVQPTIDGAVGSDGKCLPGDTPAGEFVLGYEHSRHGQMWPVPRIGDEPVPFGLNGSYLVFRQLEQDVGKFLDTTEGQYAPPKYIAAKLVGRWPDGTPLALSPDAERPGLIDKKFGFADDPFGFKCPIGAHIRRTNPRDDLKNRDDSSQGACETSLRIVRHHRLMRRGRIYGPLWREGDSRPPSSEPRGLHFICLQASIPSQFEFVQQTWLNSPKFGGLYDEVDPMVGIGQKPGGVCDFTIPARPARRRIPDMPRFITVKGGAYFFMPGIAGLRMLASCNPTEP